MSALHETPPDRARGLRRASELIGIGIGQPPADRAVASALSWRDQRRVQRRVYRGRPAWDEPSARYALVVAAAFERTMPFSPRAHRALNVFVVLIFAVALYNAVAREDVGASVLYGLMTVAFVFVGVRMPVWHRNAKRAVELNAPLLGSGSDTPTVSRPVSRRTRWLGMASVWLLNAVIVGGLLYLVFDESAATAVLTGALFSVFMVGMYQVLSARAERREAGRLGQAR